MAESAKEAVRSGGLKIIPEHHAKIWFHWMDNIRLVEEWKRKETLLFS
jgi:valyl-tRNA synthetase